MVKRTDTPRSRSELIVLLGDCVESLWDDKDLDLRDRCRQAILDLSASSEKGAPIEKCPDGQKCHSTTTGYCWGRCMRTAALSAKNAPRRLYPASEWHDDMGDVLWWRVPVNEPPWVGSPLNEDGFVSAAGTPYYTHFEFLPEAPRE